MVPRLLVYVAIFFLLLSVFHYLEMDYEYSDLKDYLTALLTASTMVFTIMGIWIAFLYPNALSRLVNPSTIENADFSETLTETKRLEGLVGSVLISAFVVTAIMVLYLLKVVFGVLLINEGYVFHAKYLTLAFVIILGLLQIQSVFYVIYSNIMFINDLHSKREDREADADV